MNTIVLFAALAALALSQKSKSKDVEDQVVLKIDQILLRTLRAERFTVAFVINIRLENKTSRDGQLVKLFSFLNYKGFDLGTFQLEEPIEIPANTEIEIPYEVYIDVSNRGIPAEIRTLWRRGVFDGTVILNGGIETTFGTFQFREIVSII